jgi:hypothetical protein
MHRMPGTEEATLVHSGEQVCTCVSSKVTKVQVPSKKVLWAGNELVTRYTQLGNA